MSQLEVAAHRPMRGMYGEDDDDEIYAEKVGQQVLMAMHMFMYLCVGVGDWALFLRVLCHGNIMIGGSTHHTPTILKCDRRRRRRSCGSWAWPA